MKVKIISGMCAYVCVRIYGLWGEGGGQREGGGGRGAEGGGRRERGGGRQSNFVQ